jgi:hypothetical protein
LIDNAAYSVILSFIQYCLPHSKDVRLQQYFLLPLLAVNHSTWREVVYSIRLVWRNHYELQESSIYNKALIVGLSFTFRTDATDIALAVQALATD